MCYSWADWQQVTEDQGKDKRTGNKRQDLMWGLIRSHENHSKQVETLSLQNEYLKNVIIIIIIIIIIVRAAP